MAVCSALLIWARGGEPLVYRSLFHSGGVRARKVTEKMGSHHFHSTEGFSRSHTHTHHSDTRARLPHNDFGTRNRKICFKLFINNTLRVQNAKEYYMWCELYCRRHIANALHRVHHWKSSMLFDLLLRGLLRLHVLDLCRIKWSCGLETTECKLIADQRCAARRRQVETGNWKGLDSWDGQTSFEATFCTFMLFKCEFFFDANAVEIET